jgi:4-amino-4-deoxy-L-arabinose transferase-like glycosyltransferase
MTDQPLVAALTGAMIGFGLYFENGSRWWARFGFACLGLSLLAKGPVGLMIPAASFGIFILVGGYWGKFFRIPWGTGLLCMLAVAAPWYLWMEYEEPGFLHYFLMQENFNRLISSDLVLRHGTAHPTFRGVGLLCFIVVTVPWLVVIPWWIRKVGVRKVLPSALPDGADRLKELYFLCWFAAPLIPFAVGKQVLPYYLLPLTQGFILWFVMVGRRLDLLHPKGLTLTASLSTIVISVGMMIMGPLFLNERRSTKPIIEAAVESFGDQHATLVFSGRVPDSAYFYLASPMSRNLRFASQSLEKIREEQNPYWVITRHKDVKNEPLLGYHERLHLSKWVIFERDGLGDEGPSRFATSGLSP